MTKSQFRNTQNKNIVREIDKKYIKDLAKDSGSKLSYFGLPGEELLDVQVWRKEISFVHAVERGEEERIGIQLQLMELGLEKDSAIFPLDLGELLQDQTTCDHLAKYHLVNFDFEGVLFSQKKNNENKKHSIKLDSPAIIRKMLALQRGKFSLNEKWLFLITFLAARNSSDKLDEDLEKLTKTLPDRSSLQNSNINEICDFLMKPCTIQAAKMATIFPILVFQDCAGFDIDCKEIVYYYGTNRSPMIHFIFFITEKKDRMQTYLNIEKIKEIPLQQIKFIDKGEVKIDNLGIPSFERKF